MTQHKINILAHIWYTMVRADDGEDGGVEGTKALLMGALSSCCDLAGGWALILLSFNVDVDPSQLMV